jgi:hypothetical protein
MGKTLHAIHRMFRATEVGWTACGRGGGHASGSSLGGAFLWRGVSRKIRVRLECWLITDHGRSVFLRTPIVLP